MQITLEEELPTDSKLSIPFTESINDEISFKSHDMLVKKESARQKDVVPALDISYILKVKE